MGFEKSGRPPEFIIKAAMKEDGTELRAIQSAGGKAAARSRAERKLEVQMAEQKVQSRLEEEREVFEEQEQRILKRDAYAHGLASAPPEEVE